MLYPALDVPLIYNVNAVPLRTRAMWYHVLETIAFAVPETDVVPMTKPGVFDAPRLWAMRISDVPGTPVEKIAKLEYVDVYVGYTQSSIVKFEAPNAVARFAEFGVFVNPVCPAAVPGLKIEPGT